MATTRKLDEDFTNQPQAASQADVDAQDARTRLWQSMNYMYGKQKEQSDKSYDQAVSQADRSMLQRGMQRSSYNSQVQANLLNQKVKAQNDIDAAQIADYQSRISQLEQQELENEWKQKEFDFQQAEADRAQSNFEIQQAFNEKQWEAQQDQWKQEFEYNKKSDTQKLAYNYVVSIIGNGGSPSDALLAQAGLSRADANAMSSKTNGSRSSGSGKYASDWYKQGFPSYAVAQQARAAGYNTYAEWLAAQQNGNPGATGGISWFDRMGSTTSGNTSTPAATNATPSKTSSARGSDTFGTSVNGVNKTVQQLLVKKLENNMK